MELNYPYRASINTKEEAAEYIKKQCSNCPRYNGMYDCRGETINKCNRIANIVAAEFSNKWVYKAQIKITRYNAG